MKKKMDIHEDYLRSVVFGFQDALVSTTGVIAGVSAGTANKEIVLLAGTVTILVEALSMGVGQYMSEKTVHQMDKDGRHTDNLVVGGFAMGISYFIGGLVPLTPIIFLTHPTASTVSIIAALIGLLVLGFIKAKIVKVNPWHSALESLLLGGAATAIGLVAGYIFKV